MNAIFTYNFVNKTIVGTKSAINRANKGMKPEYDTLCKMLAAHPDFTVVEKQIDHKTDKKKYNGLTLPRMKEYIETQPNSKERLIEFAAIQKVAATKGAKYPLTKKWFLATFHYSYYGVVDRLMAEYVNPQGIEAYIQNEQFSNAVKRSYKNIDLTRKRKRDLERFEAKKKRTAQWLREKADGRYF